MSAPGAGAVTLPAESAPAARVDARIPDPFLVALDGFMRRAWLAFWIVPAPPGRGLPLGLGRSLDAGRRVMTDRLLEDLPGAKSPAHAM